MSGGTHLELEERERLAALKAEGLSLRAIARALGRHFNLPHMDTGMLYRAVALNLWRWGGDPGNEFEALRACDVASVDPEDPELRTEAVSTIASRIANEFNEADGLQLNSLMALGCILFAITFVVLIIARFLTRRVKVA